MIEVRIYYEDTDAGGIVYHANYLRYFERGRTEFLRSHGFSVQQRHDEGVLFVVTSMNIDYRLPARLDDLLTVETSAVEAKNSYFVLNQKAVRQRDGKVLVEALVKVACVNEGMRPRRIPEAVKALFP